MTAYIIVKWNKGILKLVILISWQFEKFTRQAKAQILWVQLFRNKTSFFLSSLDTTVSTQGLFLTPVYLQENICNYHQET